MSNFLFPANPADGDIVVRGTIKGTYVASTNTWEVGEVPQYPGVPGPLGPVGPVGPQGDPGSGVNVVGAVDSESDLQVPSLVPNQFWLVNDTNTLYFSDGKEWFDLGSPIRGPQGVQGEPGTDGVDGGNGIAGRGWTGTDEIKTVSDDGVVESYKIKFNSNDGLGFTTDELVGPAGWEPVYATADVPGLIKLGRGLDLDPGGDVNVKDTFVNIETVPLETFGTSFSMQYKPITINWPTGKYQQFTTGLDNSSIPNWFTSNTVTVLPEELGSATAAIVFFQCASEIRKASNIYSTNFKGLRTYLSKNLIITGGYFNDTNAQIMGIPVTHNFTIPGVATDRVSKDAALTKNQLIRFEAGATLSFKIRVDLNTTSPCQVTAGAGRVVLLPFKYEGDAVRMMGSFVQDDGAALFATTEEEMEQLVEDFFPPVTPESINAEKATLLKEQMKDATNIINDELDYRTSTEQAALIAIRDNIWALRSLPGTYGDLDTLLESYVEELDNIVGFKFRFQPPE